MLAGFSIRRKQAAFSSSRRATSICLASPSRVRYSQIQHSRSLSNYSGGCEGGPQRILFPSDRNVLIDQTMVNDSPVR
jgi:hypothetical protein